MSPDPLDAEVRAWLASDEHDVAGWADEPPLETLHCHPDLVERLAEIARPLRGAARVFVAGCPVIHHRDGAPIACASGTSFLVVRSAQPAGALASPWTAAELDASWVSLDPWAADVTFAKAIELLRGHMRHAYENAEASAWR